MKIQTMLKFVTYSTLAKKRWRPIATGHRYDARAPILQSDRRGEAGEIVMRGVSLLLIGCLLTSCATIRHGTSEVISVDSNPSGANATIMCAGNISASGTTPAQLTIPRKADGCHVDVEKNGMKTQKIQIERGFDSAYWLNFVPASGLPLGTIAVFSTGIFGPTPDYVGVLFAAGILGGVGLIVDRVNGAMYDHDPHVIKVNFEPQQ
jgi:hypothetical protein